MKFVKMHGAGNDYVYVDCFRQTIEDPESLAREISDRNFGVGGDGLFGQIGHGGPGWDGARPRWRGTGSR